MRTLPLRGAGGGAPGRGGAPPFDVVGIGEVSVDHVCLVPALPVAGTASAKVKMTRFARAGGGQVATAMVACQRLGLRTRLVGLVGDDEAGAAAIAGLAEEGVDARGVRRVAGAGTRFAILLVDERDGERVVVGGDERGLEYPPGAPTDDELTCARALHVDLARPAIALAALRRARAAGMVTSADLDHLPAGPPERLDEILGLLDLCVMAEAFPTALTGERDPEAALRAIARRFPRALHCVTLGAHGCAALVPPGDGDGDGDGEVVRVAAFPVPGGRAVDTTGCGDVFHGAMVYAALAGFEVVRALRFACAAAAHAARALGAQAGVPTLAEVEALLGAPRP